MTQFISLNGGTKVSVTDETYARILELVQARGAQCCEACQQPFTTGNPQVVVNRCLRCYLRWDNKNNALRYIGPAADGSGQYLWMDGAGGIRTSDPKRTSHLGGPQEDKRATLEYYGFTLPTSYEGRPLLPDGSRWHIYGNVCHHPAVVVSYDEELFFILRHDGSVEPVNTRGKLYRDTKRALLDTKDAHGYIQIAGKRQAVYKDRVYTSWVMEQIAWNLCMPKAPALA